MKSHFLKAWKILFCIAVSLAFLGCGDSREDDQKAIAVRKKIVLPSEGTGASGQGEVVTKKIPDIAAARNQPEKPEEKKEPTVKAEVTPEPEQKDQKPEPAPEPERADQTPKTEPKSEALSEILETDELQGEEKPVSAQQTTSVADVPREVVEEPASVPDENMEPITAQIAPADEPTDSGGVSDSALASILGIAREKKQTRRKGYDPAGKVDPFEPLFQERKQEETPPEEEAPAEEDIASDKPKKKKRVPRTPLEKMDLNQLKLVGVIRAESGNRALIQEASGKGYIISRGTYIGIHSGKVAEILKDRIIVEEEYEDIRGEVTVRKRELKIEKPPGEGYHEM